eukprot:COSAG04_NODE_12_length_42844_cov_6.769213_26_plen_62_part_00
MMDNPMNGAASPADSPAAGDDLGQSLIDRQVDAAVAAQLEKDGQITVSIRAVLAHLSEAPT